MRLLVTGFEPFGGAGFNPSEAIVRRLEARPPVADFHALVLPVEYEAAARIALAAIDRVEPDLVVMFGLAGKVHGLRIERCGRNVTTSSAPDNAGVCRTGAPVVEGCADRIDTRIDLDRLLAALRPDVPDVFISDDAGGYVCNALYTAVLHHLDRTGRPTPALFVHVPERFDADAAPDLGGPGPDGHERAARLVISAAIEATSLSAGPRT